jgi:hypothetical protein
MIIPSAQIALRKVVGKWKKGDVIYTKLKGGLHLISDHLGKVIAASPHVAVSRFLAQKYEPDIQWTELSKSEHYMYDEFKHLIPEAEELTAQAKRLQK